jgi:hypothetical protein
VVIVRGWIKEMQRRVPEILEDKIEAEQANQAQAWLR